MSETTLSLEIGDKSTITATVLPSNTTNKTVSFSSNDEGIATVSQSGEITAIAEGTATITGKTINNLTATCNLTVTDSTIS